MRQLLRQRGTRERSYYTVQSSPGPQSSQNAPNCKLKQPTNLPSNPQATLCTPLFAFGSSITMRVRYSIHTHTHREAQ